jgi:hypothetical protein
MKPIFPIKRLITTKSAGVGVWSFVGAQHAAPLQESKEKAAWAFAFLDPPK